MKHETAPVKQILEELRLTRTHLLAIGAATLSTLAFSGAAAPKEAGASAGSEAADNAIAVENINSFTAESMNSESAANEQGTTCPEFGKGVICYWKIRKTENWPGTDRHAWRNCVRFHKSRFRQHVTCSIAKSKSNSVTAEVSGSRTVPLGVISAKVGYNVTKTTTITTSDTVDVPKRTSGVVQWAAVFGNRKRVTQEYQPCYETAPGHFDRCFPRSHPIPGNLAYAYTEKYDTPVFRVVKSK